MNATHRLIAALVASLVAVAPAHAAQRGRQSPPKAKSSHPSAPAPEMVPTAKAVTYGPRDIVAVNTQLRYTTLIILPKDEVILDFVCGDKDLWSIEGEQNFAYVKPSTEKSKTNLSLVTAAGNVFSFVLREVSGGPDTPDLKVFVELAPAGADAPPVQPTRRLVSAQELEDTRADLERAKAETARVRKEARDTIDAGAAEYATNVRFAYRFEAGKPPFRVRAMFHDDRFTYIQARPEETPTLMELVDGRPSLVEFSYRNGLYVIPKIIDRGYLVIGRKRLSFRREE